MRLWRKIKCWLGFRPRSKFVGEPCPSGHGDYRPICRFAQGKECQVETLEQALCCCLNDDEAIETIRWAMAVRSLAKDAFK